MRLSLSSCMFCVSLSMGLLAYIGIVCMEYSMTTNIDSTQTHERHIRIISDVLRSYMRFGHVRLYLGVHSIKEHMQMKMTLFWTLSCLALALPLAAGFQYDLRCVEFYRVLATFVDCNGNCPEMLTDLDCSRSSLVHKMLMHEMVTINTTLHFDWLAHPVELSELIVLATIGRHFVRQPGVKTPYFNWEQYTNSLVLNQLSCEFQRPLYGFILISTLVFVVIFLAMHTMISTPAVSHKEDPSASPAVSFRVTKTSHE
jgi:hypothetical protein